MKCFDCCRSVEELCNDCSCCNICCYCPPKIKLVKRKLKFYHPKQKELKHNSSSRLIAAEIEVAKLKAKSNALEKMLKKWNCSIVYDGSLPSSGFEINTAPAGGDIFIKQIKEICGELNNAGAIVNKKCGLHIHLDARDFNYKDIQSLIKVYNTIEPCLFAMVEEHRRRSHYCMPCAEKYMKGIPHHSWYSTDGKVKHHNVKNNVVDSVYGANGLPEKKSKYNDARYNALNLHSWFYRGTIEYRLLEGTIDPKEIINWGMMWSNILNYALNVKDDTIETKSVNVKQAYKNLLAMMNGNKVLDKFIKTRYKRNK